MFNEALTIHSTCKKRWIVGRIYPLTGLGEERKQMYVQHTNYDEAQQEAERLALSNHGSVFGVFELKTVSIARNVFTRHVL